MIGFRLPRHMIEKKLLKDYFKIFDFIEIKIGNSISDKELDSLINLLFECISQEKVSIHLPKNSLYDLKEYETCIKIIKKIVKYKIKRINLVVHFEFYNFIIINRILYLVSILKDQENLLIENVCKFYENEKYISEMENVLKTVNSSKLGVCMDFGHYLFGCLKEGIEQERAIDRLLKHTLLVKKINELHMHDFNQQRDHLTIGTGNMMMKLIFEKMPINVSVPIVIESTVKDPNKDGLNQVIMIQKVRRNLYANL